MPAKFAFIVSRFPKLTETFILQEMRGLEERGVAFELFSLVREAPAELQPDAAELDARANYIPMLSLETVLAQLRWLVRSPCQYLGAWRIALRAASSELEALVRMPTTVALAAAMALRMERLGVERVHAHWATYPTTAALVVKHLTGIPYSFTCHAHDVYVERFGLPTFMAETDLVLSCTDTGRAIIARRCGEEAAAKVHVVHHGARLERFAFTPVPDASGRPLRLITVAALQEYKGHRYLLEALRSLRDRGVPVVADLVGDGPLRESLRTWVSAAGLDDVVTFHGRLPSDQVRELVGDSDVAVLPAIQMPDGESDGIPNVLVEAMASGRPVIATIMPGIMELVIDGDNGLLVPQHDAPALADAIERLATDGALRQRLATAGRARVEAEHDARHNLDEVHRLLSALPPSVGATRRPR